MSRTSLRPRLADTPYVLLHRARHPFVAMGAIIAILAPQIFFPLASALAQERVGKEAPGIDPQTGRPANSRPLGKGTAASPGNKGAKPGKIKPSQNLRSANRLVSPLALDLSRPPTEKELRQLGGMSGALAPIGNADVEVLKRYLDQELKAAGIPDGLEANAPANTPAGKVLIQAREKVERLQVMNWTFGEAVQKQLKHDFDASRQLLEKHLADFPDSPWAAEANFRLVLDAQYSGRPGEAQSRLEDIMRRTNVPMIPLDALAADAGLNGTVEAGKGGEADKGGNAAQERVAPENPRHPAYEVRQKAKQGWADLDIMLGQWEQAGEKLHNILETDNDWRRRTWAAHWLKKVQLHRDNSEQARQLRACGTEALSVILVSAGKGQAAAKVRNMPIPRDAGYSLAELQSIASRNGVSMRGFHARVEQLADLPKPAIIHYDLSRATRVKGSEKEKPAGAASQHKTAASKTPFTVSNPGHFLVLQSVDAKKKNVLLYDPQEQTQYTLTFADLEREWSGYGLAPAKNVGKAKILLADLSVSPEKLGTLFGGCCCGPTPPDDLGDNDNNQRGGPPGNGCGSPVWSVNRVTLNLFITDTPLWYSPPIGPSVSINMAYNSHDALNNNTKFGNKWAFNYGAYVIENPGGSVILFLPGGTQKVFMPDPQNSGAYIAPTGTFDTLTKSGSYHYELATPTGEKLIYDIPSGTTSIQPYLVEQQDRWGYSLTFGYTQQNGNIDLTTITDAQSKVTTLEYDTAGHIVRVTDPFERQATFSYDGNGNMVEVVDMEGNPFQYTYDADILVTEINSLQGPWTFAHASMSNEITITDPLNQEEKFGYNGYIVLMNDAYGIPVCRYTDPKGRITTWWARQLVDGKGKLTDAFLPNNHHLRWHYDGQTGQVAKFTDGYLSGKTTHYAYNANGRLTSVTDPQGRTSQIGYASNGLDMAWVKNTRGEKIASFAFNSQHLPTSGTIDPDNLGNLQSTSSTTYTAWGALASVTDPNNVTTTYNYNSDKRLSTVVRSSVTLATYTYDDIGRVQSVTDSSGQWVSYQHDSLNRVTSTTYSDSTTTEADYSCCGLAGTVKDRAGRKIYYDYDQLKRLSRVQDAGGNTLELEYDKAGNLAQYVDARGKITRFEYDNLDRLVKKVFPNAAFEAFSYDAADGNLMAYRNARGMVTQYSYDSADNLTQIDYPNSPDVSFTYNDLDQITGMSDALGTSSSLFGYDLLGRLKYENQPWNDDTVNYGYDSLGRRNRVSIGYSSAYDVVMAFDSLGRADGLTTPAGYFNYNYSDNSSRLSSIYIPNSSRAQYGYDTIKRLTQVANKQSNGTNIAQFDYGFDASNQPQREVRTYVDKTMGAGSTQRVSFGYDTIDQLTSELSNETPTPDINRSYAYDVMGNRTGATNVTASTTFNTSYSTNLLNQYSAVATTWDSGNSTSTAALTYDQSGNLTKQSVSATGSGAPSLTEYAYDDLERLIRVTHKNPATQANLSKSEYTYDGFSRLRVSKEFTWNGTAWSEQYASEKRRIYDGMDVIQEKNVYGGNIATYVRDGNIGGLLSKEDASGNRFFYHYDGSGNVVAMTDQSQNTVAEYSYDAWGNTLSSTGTQAASNTYRFSTKEYMTGAGLYNYGYRFYSPGMGRWINRDPIGESGGLNLYAMVGNDPINYVDDYGHGRVKVVRLAASGFKKVLGISDEAALRAIDEGENLAGPPGKIKDLLEKAGHKNAPRDTPADFNAHRHTNDRNGGHFFEESATDRKFNPAVSEIKQNRRNSPRNAAPLIMVPPTGNSFRDDFRNNAAPLTVPHYTQGQHPAVQLGGEFLDFFNPLSLPADVADIADLIHSLLPKDDNPCP